jgi:hypothetical protein
MIEEVNRRRKLMTQENITTEALTVAGYPLAEEMVNLVNTDMLQFWDEHEPVEYLWTEKRKVVSLIDEQGKDFIFKREDGGQLGVWKEYFLDPEQWKKNRVLKMQGITY